MRAIIGIGNPGESYRFNRHNIGFNVADFIAEEWNQDFNKTGDNYIYTKGELDDSPFIIAKPTTFMNISGKAVKKVMSDNGLKHEDILIIHDEVNLALGICKLKLGGGDGGHNGVASIIYELISDKFARIRVGIGNNFVPGRMANYVLSDFKKTEFELITASYDYCIRIAETFIRGGVKKMLDFNSALQQNKNNPII